jgi:hypothetical protein
MGGLQRTAGARGRRRGRDLAAFKQEQKRFALNAWDAEVSDACRSLRTIGTSSLN